MIRNRARAQPRPAPATWVELDLAALQHNVRTLRARLPGSTELWAVVKGNAYGHGAVPCARAAVAASADRLVVSRIGEVEELRGAGIDAPILLLGPLLPDEAAAAVETGAAICVGDLDLARALSAAAVTARGRPVDVHLKLDTGMARYGVPATTAATFARAVALLPGLRVAGIASHFTGCTAADLPAMERQLRCFRAAAADCATAAPHAALHLANSLGTLLLPAAHLDAVRIGGGLFGFDPLHGTPGVAGLRPVLALKTRLVDIKSAAAGTPVGYAGTWVCPRATRLGVLPLGYGDGLPRALWHGAEVLVRGARVPLRGLLNMNQLVIDLERAPAARPGCEVVLIGAQGDGRVLAEERVPAGGSVYEVTCLLPRDLPRLLVTGHDGADVASEASRGAGPPDGNRRAALPRSSTAHLPRRPRR